MNGLYFSLPGHGVFATVDIAEGSFVCEYKGMLMSAKDGCEIEKEYESQGQGNFLYFFEWKGNKYWLVLFTFYILLDCNVFLSKIVIKDLPCEFFTMIDILAKTVCACPMH